jgi:excinuclease ABC subunit C
MTDKVKKIVNKLPSKPGVYRMIGKEGDILYIGKAKDLKKRVTSYFKNISKQPIRTQKLVSQIQDIQITEVSSELEALMLETNLIKENRPKYNILMKDDKNFIYIKVTVNEDFPKILLVRKVEKDGAKYFGPKTSVFKVKATLKTLRDIFPFRSCNIDIQELNAIQGNILKKSNVRLRNKSMKVPCLYYHIKKCAGPCIGKITKNEYKQIIEKVMKFLTGRHNEIEKSLKDEMTNFAIQKNFEKAAKIRDTLQSLEVLKERQLVTTVEHEDIDIINFVFHLGKIYFNIFNIRNGKLINQENFVMISEDIKEIAPESAEQELMNNFIVQYYDKVEDFPKKILLPFEIKEKILLKNWLKQKSNKSINLISSKIGKNTKLLELSKKNALIFAKKSEISWENEKRNVEKAQTELKKYLNLKGSPKRIECYDVSHLSGTGKVASMIVFENGIPKNQDYRRFTIKTLEEGTSDDYACMKEILGRRFKRLSLELLNKKIIFKKATKKDESSIKKILNEKINLKDFTIVFVDKKFAGFIKLSKITYDCAEINNLYISPEIKDDQLGYRLMREIIFKNKFNKFYLIPLQKLISYYEKFGFKFVKEISESIKKYLGKRNKNSNKLKNLKLMILEKKQIKKDDSFEKKPDLVVVDGGKGQLSVALSVLKPYKIPCMGLAKQFEDVYVENKSQPVKIPKDSEAMYLLQRIRDEAHRFAISHQKILRKHKAEKSVLDTIPGVGDSIKRKLLRHFGSVAKIKEASIEDITKVVGQEKLACRIKLFLGN